jgi:hypothetical protein
MNRILPALALAAVLAASLRAQDPTPTSAEAALAAPAETGTVQITTESEQQVEVWIDGRRIGLTPLKGKVPAGERLITAGGEGLQPAIQRVTIMPGDSQRISLRTQPLVESSLGEVQASLIAEIERDPRNAHLHLLRALTSTDPDVVLNSLAQAEKLATGSPTAAMVKANWMLRDKKGTEAVAALAPALEKAPRYAALHRTRAKALAVAGRDDEAMASADQAVQLDPRDWQNLYVRGIVRREKGDIAGAREDLQNALSLSPANAMVKKALDGLNAAPRP